MGSGNIRIIDILAIEKYSTNYFFPNPTLTPVPRPQTPDKN
jgi:hypothetical protein